MDGVLRLGERRYLRGRICSTSVLLPGKERAAIGGGGCEVEISGFVSAQSGRGTGFWCCGAATSDDRLLPGPTALRGTGLGRAAQ